MLTTRVEPEALGRLGASIRHTGAECAGRAVVTASLLTEVGAATAAPVIVSAAWAAHGRWHRGMVRAGEAITALGGALEVAGSSYETTERSLTAGFAGSP